MSKLVGILIAALVALTSTGCDTVTKVNSLLDTYTKLGKNIDKTITDVKDAAKSVATSSPATSGRVPTPPASKTGGKNLGETSEGETGTAQEDIDDDGEIETLSVFVDASDATYVAWEGDAASDDTGVCYLAWEESGDQVWFIAAPCSSSEGYLICTMEGDGGTCDACNMADQCQSCDLEAESCDLPDGGDTDMDAGSDEGECEEACDYFLECFDECYDVCASGGADELECLNSVDDCSQVATCSQ